jgi:hypothetical protein
VTVDAAGAELTLLIDVGTGWTKGVAVGQARGRWRIAATVSQPTSWGEDALLESLIHRLRPHVDPRLDRNLQSLVISADRVVCRSLPHAGRLAVSGADPLAADRAAVVAAAAGWVVAESGAQGDGRPASARLSALLEAEPDAWLLAVGDNGATDGARDAAALIVAADAERGRPVMVSGNPTPEIEELLNLSARTADAEAPAVPLRSTLDAQLLSRAGMTSGRSWTAVALERSVGALARALERDVLAVDMGVQWGNWVAATAVGDTARTVRPLAFDLTDEGFDAELSAHLAAVSHQSIDDQAIQDHLANAAARPGTMPQTPSEAAVAHAARRLQLTRLRRQAGGCPPVDLVIGCGRGIAALQHPAESALTLLDGVRPSGVVQLAVDTTGVLPTLGALADGEVGEGVITLLDDLLVPLGTAIVTRGGRPGNPALRVILHRVGWSPTDPIEVRAGSLTSFPLGRGERGEVEIELLGGTTLGGHRSGRLRAEVSGGALGVIIDARDDPIGLPSRPADRRAVLGGWRDALRRDLAPPEENG